MKIKITITGATGQRDIQTKPVVLFDEIADGTNLRNEEYILCRMAINSDKIYLGNTVFNISHYLWIKFEMEEVK